MEENILKNIQSKRIILKIVCVLSVVFAVVWVIFVENDIFIRKIDITKMEINTGNEYIHSLDDVSWKKDDISITKDYVTLSGWLIKKGEDAKTVSIKVVFQDMNTEQCYVIPTTMFERDDVTENINDGLDYKNSGFSVKIDRKSVV